MSQIATFHDLRGKSVFVTGGGSGIGAALKETLQRQCLKDTIAPEDIVDAALFLASDTSRMMTGQAIVVDGGIDVTG